MKKVLKMKLAFGLISVFLLALTYVPYNAKGQNMKKVQAKYFTSLPTTPVANTLQKYRMTAEYINRDLYGNFMDKIKVTGDYTRGMENGNVKWENVTVSGSNKYPDPFPPGTKQEYMENMKYVPSAKMLDTEAFKNFPVTPAGVFAKNLIWDMMTIEGFAWDHADSLKLNRIYMVPNASDEFNMADVGTYSHAGIQLCWTGISLFREEMFAVIEFRAIDNKLAMSMPGFSTKGTEQYWGTIWISFNSRLIEKAVMYGGTFQEIEVTGMPNKLLIKTIRELWVDKIM